MRVPTVEVINTGVSWIVRIGNVCGANPDLNNAIYAAVDAFVNGTPQTTTTGEVIHSCGFIHGDSEPCPQYLKEPNRNHPIVIRKKGS